MSTSGSKVFLYCRRLYTTGWQPRIGAAAALIGLGYSLSIEDPLSYIPYGLCRTFEGVSETFPSLRIRRLSVFVRASQFAERWHLEAPFLNAYFLDRLCREAITTCHFKQSFSGDRTLLSRLPPVALTASSIPLDASEACPTLLLPSLDVLDTLEAASVPCCPPIPSEGLPPTAESLPGDGEVAPEGAEPDAETPSAVSDTSKTVRSSALATLAVPFQALKRWSGMLRDWIHSAILRGLECTSPEVWFATAQAFAERHLMSNDLLEPLTLATLDRISHITRELDPYVRDIDRLSFLYLTVSQFLSYAAVQRPFQEDLARLPGLEGDRRCLQLFHIGLLATHRVAYWNSYEATVVTPEPPPALPLASQPQPRFTRGLWKRYSGRDSGLAVLLRSFSPQSGQLKRELSLPKETAAGDGKAVAVSDGRRRQGGHSLRMIGNWSSQELAVDCRKRLRIFWYHIAASGPLRTAAQRVIWRDELRRPAPLDVSQTQRTTARTAAGAAVANARSQILVTQMTHECEALKGAIRTLVQKLPSSADDADVIGNLHTALVTPRTLNPFCDAYGPSFASRCFRTLTDNNALGTFLLGALTMTGVWFLVDVLGTCGLHPCSWNAWLRRFFFGPPRAGRPLDERESYPPDHSTAAYPTPFGVPPNYASPADPASFLPYSMMNDAAHSVGPNPYSREPYFYPNNSNNPAAAHQAQGPVVGDPLQFPFGPPIPMPGEYVYLDQPMTYPSTQMAGLQ